MNKTTRLVVRGQRFESTLTDAGLIVRQDTQLVRAEDPQQKVNAWMVTLSPIFKKGVGPDIQGQSFRGGGVAPFASTSAGFMQLLMTWGGGGVNFRTQFTYPVNGAAFAVAGDNIMLSVFASDFVTVFTEQNKPCCEAWVSPWGQPTSPQPIVERFGPDDNVGVTTEIIPPWARRITVTKDTLGASVALMFDGVIHAQLETTDTELTVPIPCFAQTFRIIPSAGKAIALVELCFT